MKKYILYTFILLLSFLSGSCSKNEIKIDKDNLLIGVWNYSHSTGDVSIYSRAQEFTQSFGYKFNLDGTLIERYLSGFCATPPISYSDYTGTWTILKDNLIQVNRSNFDGPKSYELNIQSVNSDSLKIISAN
jgi:hypothetical protein